VSGWQEALYHRVPVPFQNWLLTRHGRLLRQIRFDENYRRLRAEFAELERAGPAQQEAYQADRLERLIRHCYERIP
jgi:hypothetical protein